MRPSPLAAVALAATLCACAAPRQGDCLKSGDPRAGGFISGISNTLDGTYDCRIATKQGQLDAESQARQGNVEALRQAQQDQAATQQERQQLETEYGGLQGDLDRINARIDKAKRGNAAKAAEQRDLKQQVSAIKAQIERLRQDDFSGIEAKKRQLEKVREQKQQLDEQVKQMMHD